MFRPVGANTGRVTRQEHSVDYVVMEVVTLPSAHNTVGCCTSAPRVTLCQCPVLTSGGFFQPALVINPNGFLGTVSSGRHWPLGTECWGKSSQQSFWTDLFPLTTWHLGSKRQEEQHARVHWQAYRASWSGESYRFCWHSRKQTEDLGYCGVFCLFLLLFFFFRGWMKEWH